MGACQSVPNSEPEQVNNKPRVTSEAPQNEPEVVDVVIQRPQRVFGSKQAVVLSGNPEGDDEKAGSAEPENENKEVEGLDVEIEVEEAGGEQAGRSYRDMAASSSKPKASSSTRPNTSSTAAKSSNSGGYKSSGAKSGAVGVMFSIPPKVLQRLATAVPYDDKRKEPLHRIYRVATQRREDIKVDSGEFQVTGQPADIENYRRALTSWLEYEVSAHDDYNCPAAVDAVPCMPALDLARSNLEEILFFPENPLLPNPHKDLLAVDPQEWRLLRFMQVLRSPKKSLDIAIYNLTHDPIAQTIIDLAKQGVKVRVFTEYDNVDSGTSDVRDLVKAGIEVRRDGEGDHLMHHKFALLDGIVLVNGSFNWSKNAGHGNFENVVITKNPVQVKAFKAEFERIWTLPNSAPLGSHVSRDGAIPTKTRPTRAGD